MHCRCYTSLTEKKNVNEGVMLIFACELIDLDMNVKKLRPDESPYWNCFHSYNTMNSFIM